MSRESQAKAVRNSIVKMAKGETSLDANEIRVILSLERIVARLSSDPKLDKHLIYKGGFVLLKTLNSNRFTRDLDALGLDIEKEVVEKLVPRALDIDLNDGFWFGDVRVESLDAQGEYGALRFNCAFQIGDPPEKAEAIKKLSRLHFDVGFGDAIPSDLKLSTMPSLLGYETQVSWRVYPPEFIFSEKLQTFVNRSSANSRGKDIHDLGILFEQCEPTKLKEAILETFSRRETPIPTSFVDFAKDVDTNVLENSWRSVKLTNEDTNFEDAWKLLLKHLSKIDQNMMT
ncbi:MAG: nucleotidyl transferase AbiEii/AbiGii toxin family protein [Bdellovibrionaceae bacterium]|nr:nucleotidyl transferase AbiEii/AbiGii toxin family protein [Pseudobdellovibrionaceae bacterium]